jgi:hypothetical protein
MRSIPLAMTWELLWSGRWGLVAAALAANAVPIAILAALRTEGAINPDDSSGFLMHLVMMQLNMVIFGAALLVVQGEPARLYAWPLRTSTLVAWRLLPTMALAAVESIACTLLINKLFQLGWPLWGPALFLAVGMAAVSAARWLTDRSAWIVPAIALVGLVLGLWNKARYGAMFSEPTRLWRHVTPSEVAFLLAVTFFAYGVGVAAVARNRRGEAPLSLGILARIDRWLDPGPRVDVPFPTPSAAHGWAEWRQKGWVMPITVLVSMLVGLVAWLASIRDARELWGGALGFGSLLPWIGVIGAMLFGNTNPRDGDMGMGQSLATRPISCTGLAYAILRTAAKSTALTWGLWAACVLVVGLAVGAAGIDPWPAARGLAWWYAPATLLGTWVVLATLAAILLVGRLNRTVKGACAGLAVFLGLTLLVRYALPPAVHAPLRQGLVAGTGAILVLATTWAFVAARRRALVDAVVPCVAACVWLTLLAGILEAAVTSSSAPWSGCVFFAGLAALVVAPLATTPLAIASNRHR